MKVAKQRDCVVRVFWTGDADLDLLVEEPTGSVCSLRNFRSTAGGVLCGDVSGDGSLGSGGHCQMYLCPKGFSGNYKLLVRRVWGHVVGGKVSVEVRTHFFTPKEATIRKQIALDKNEAMVKFNLADGRRKDKLSEQQVANAATSQLAVGQQILAQQIATLADPSALNSLAVARRATDTLTTSNTGTTTTTLADFSPTQAVGYQPVIITLPEGANLAASGVVSADRRYVRISCVPLFSSITKVTTFNFVSGSGSSSQGPGGTGYSGF